MSKFISLFHILIVGSLFLYLGINKTNVPKYTHKFLLVLGIIIIGYHLYKMYLYGKPNWVNLMHIIFIGPLLVYIGYNKEKTAEWIYQIILLLGFATIGYHIYYLVKSM